MNRELLGALATALAPWAVRPADDNRFELVPPRGVSERRSLVAYLEIDDETYTVTVTKETP